MEIVKEQSCQPYLRLSITDCDPDFIRDDLNKLRFYSVLLNLNINIIIHNHSIMTLYLKLDSVKGVHANVRY